MHSAEELAGAAGGTDTRVALGESVRAGEEGSSKSFSSSDRKKKSQMATQAFTFSQFRLQARDWLCKEIGNEFPVLYNSFHDQRLTETRAKEAGWYWRQLENQKSKHPTDLHVVKDAVKYPEIESLEAFDMSAYIVLSWSKEPYFVRRDLSRVVWMEDGELMHYQCHIQARMFEGNIEIDSAERMIVAPCSKGVIVTWFQDESGFYIFMLDLTLRSKVWREFRAGNPFDSLKGIFLMTMSKSFCIDYVDTLSEAEKAKGEAYGVLLKFGCVQESTFRLFQCFIEVHNMKKFEIDLEHICKEDSIENFQMGDSKQWWVSRQYEYINLYPDVFLISVRKDVTDSDNVEVFRFDCNAMDGALKWYMSRISFNNILAPNVQFAYVSLDFLCFYIRDEEYARNVSHLQFWQISLDERTEDMTAIKFYRDFNDYWSCGKQYFKDEHANLRVCNCKQVEKVVEMYSVSRFVSGMDFTVVKGRVKSFGFQYDSMREAEIIACPFSPLVIKMYMKNRERALLCMVGHVKRYDERIFKKLQLSGNLKEDRWKLLSTGDPMRAYLKLGLDVGTLCVTWDAVFGDPIPKIKLQEYKVGIMLEGLEKLVKRGVDAKTVLLRDILHMKEIQNFAVFTSALYPQLYFVYNKDKTMDVFEKELR